MFELVSCRLKVHWWNHKRSNPWPAALVIVSWLLVIGLAFRAKRENFIAFNLGNLSYIRDFLMFLVVDVRWNHNDPYPVLESLCILLPSKLVILQIIFAGFNEDLRTMLWCTLVMWLLARATVFCPFIAWRLSPPIAGLLPSPHVHLFTHHFHHKFLHNLSLLSYRHYSWPLRLTKS